MESPHDERYSSQYLNLAEERLGSVVLETTDDFFADKENLIKPGSKQKRISFRLKQWFGH